MTTTRAKDYFEGISLFWFFSGTAALTIILSLILYGHNLLDYFMADDFSFIVKIPTFSGEAEIIPSQGAAWLRPLYHLSFFTDLTFWGHNPFGYHLTNLILNSIAVVLVAILAYLLFGNRLAAFLSGLFFALNPLHAEPIIWISGRVDLLVTIFAVLSLIFYVSYDRQGSSLYLIASFISLALALLSKENALILPLILISYDLLLSEKGKGWWKRKLPGYLLISSGLGLYLLIRFYLIGSLGGYVAHGGTGTDLQSLFTGMGRAIFLPVNLEIFVREKIALSFTLLMFLFVGIGIRSFKDRIFQFGLLFVAFAALSLLGGLPLKSNLENARYYYLVSVGLVIALTSLAISPPIKPSTRIVRGGILAAILVFMGLFSFTNGIAWSRGAQVTYALTHQTTELYPHPETGSQFFFFGVPSHLDGSWLFDDMSSALNIDYGPGQVEAFSDNIYQDDNFGEITSGLGKSKFALFWNSDQGRLEDVTGPLIQRKLLTSWSGDEIERAWSVNNLSRTQAGQFQAQGSDPNLVSPTLAFSDQLVMVELKMKVSSSASGYGQVYFSSPQGPFNEDETSRFSVKPDGQWHTYQIWTVNKGAWGRKVQAIRLDPTSFPAQITIESVKLWGADSEAMKSIRSGT